MVQGKRQLKGYALRKIFPVAFLASAKCKYFAPNYRDRGFRWGDENPPVVAYLTKYFSLDAPLERCLKFVSIPKV